MSTGHEDLDAWKRRRTIELAFELADSGRYEDFTDVAYALQFERGMATAQALIDDPEMRRVLNQRCADALDKFDKLKPSPVLKPEPEIDREALEASFDASSDASNDHAQTPRTADFERAPSLLRRALNVVWRGGGTADLNSAAS